MQLEDTGSIGFGSPVLTIFLLLMTVVNMYEYYRRRSWNNDLLHKVVPVLLCDKDSKSSSKESIEENSPNIAPPSTGPSQN